MIPLVDLKAQYASIRTEVNAAIQGVLDANPAKVAEYRGGKKGLTGFFTGQVMKATNGQADPKAVAKLLNEMLG